MTRVCTQCGGEFPESEFTFRDRQQGVLHRRCRACVRAYFRDYYARHREVYAARIRLKNAAERRRNRELLLTSLHEHPCVDCGESDPVVPQFDHEDPGDEDAQCRRPAAEPRAVEAHPGRDREVFGALRQRPPASHGSAVWLVQVASPAIITFL